MKVLVLEDEYVLLKGAFDYLNVKYYGGNLEIKNIGRTQDVDMNNLNQYDKIFVDISLQQASEMDGYSFIKAAEKWVDKAKLVVITGSDKVQQKIAEFGLGPLAILNKPVTFLDLRKVMPG
ncbi:MAG: response regulator [Bacteroidota bacterium]